MPGGGCGWRLLPAVTGGDWARWWEVAAPACDVAAGIRSDRAVETLMPFSEIRVSSAGYSPPDGLLKSLNLSQLFMHFFITSELLLSELLRPQRGSLTERHVPLCVWLHGFR